MEEQLVVFELANEAYGIDISRVQSIIQMQEVAVIPGAPRFIEGVINLRGTIVPVVNLRDRFDLQPAVEGQKTVIVIVELEGLQVGMTVDKVTDVIKVQENAIEPPSPLLASVDTAYLRGIAKIGRRESDEKRMVILLDINRVFTWDEQQALKQAV